MLQGKNVVVTGCLQGIGHESVRIFSEKHANIVACAYKKDEQFEEYCMELARKNCVQIFPVYVDFMNYEEIKNAAKTIQKTGLEINGLVNVAGINKDAFFNMVTKDDLIDTFQVNFFSQIYFTQYILKLMQRTKKGGSIVFTSSVTAIDGCAGQTSYGASKAALIGAMKSMAIELGSCGIRVNAVAPGVIKTPMTDKLDDDIISDRINKMDIPKLGSTEDVANMYAFLLSDLSAHITGQIIRVDGGMR